MSFTIVPVRVGDVTGVVSLLTEVMAEHSIQFGTQADIGEQMCLRSDPKTCTNYLINIRQTGDNFGWLLMNEEPL